jgi:MFS family permease
MGGPFLKLWIAQACAQLAAQVSFLAVPLVAATVLDASAVEMGILTAAAALPSLIFGLHAGVFVDSRERRPVMIGADLVRIVALAGVPLAWWLDFLSIPVLCAVVVVSGIGSLLFDVAYQALLPHLLDRRRLVEGNARLELTRTGAELAGPGIAGTLVQVAGAPLTLLLNAGLYLGSALAIWTLRVREPVAALSHGHGSGTWSRIREGIVLAWATPSLRLVIGASGLLGFFNAMLEAVFVLFVVRALGVGPVTLGIVFGVGGLGFLVGALLPPAVNRRLGIGVATAAALAAIGVSDLLVPLAEGTGRLVIPLLILAQFLFGIGMTMFNVNQASIRQALVPGPLLGRVTATARFLAMGAVPVGALAGGVLGEAIGLRETLTLAALGEAAVGLWLWRSPLRFLRRLPEDDPERPVGSEENEHGGIGPVPGA